MRSRRLVPAVAGLLLVSSAAARAGAASVTYVVDPASSRVLVHLGRSGLMKFLGHEHHIEAKIAEGRVLVEEADPARSSVTLRFESAKLAVVPGSEPAEDIPKVEERMRGPEVLEVARHPEIAFASTAVRRIGAQGARQKLVVAGTLTLRDRSYPLELPLEVQQDAGALEASGEARLRLRDLGVEPPSVAGVVKVSNEFRLELKIRAVASQAP